MEPHLWVPPFLLSHPLSVQYFPWTVLAISSALLERQPLFESPPSHAFLAPPLMKATPPFLVATSWEWLKEYYSRLVAGQEEEKKGEGAWLRGVGLGLESESESWGC